jgi:hypothetical protein
MKLKVLPTEVRSMPLNCEPEVFIAEYKACFYNPERPTNYLYQLVKPFLLHWAKMLLDSNYPKDINYISMCKRINCKDYTKAIRKFVYHCQRTTSVIEELEIIFFTRIRSLRYFPTNAGPKMAEYVIASDFRNYLKDRINAVYHQPVLVSDNNIEFQQEEIKTDFLLHKNFVLTPWQRYLAFLNISGMNPYEIHSLTKMCRKQISRDLEKICHQSNEK